MRKRFVLPLFTAILVLSGCFFDGGGSSNPTSLTDNGEWDTTYSYPITQLTGTQIINSYPTRYYGYCSMVSTGTSTTQTFRYDTSKARLDTVSYKIVGSLMFVGGDTTTIGNSGKALYYSIYSRVSGATSSIIGTWMATGRDSLQPLNMPETDSSLNSRRALDAASTKGYLDAGAVTQITFTQTLLTLQRKDGNWAKLELVDWNDYNAGHYSVTANIIDANTIVFIGKSETVTKKRLDRNRTQYSSTNAAHATYVEYSRPSSVAQCPENTWFDNFLSANFKSTATAGGRIASQELVPKKMKLWL